ncbi:gastrula zinc finger protein xLCGF3.1-like [Narcine bancroftii]|uniref:gastrula zinc finger protein xLCGF3.1-like n=1 Tax=Narcine bancroftii TaxID=1343680 RepID=UPI003831C5F3
MHPLVHTEEKPFTCPECKKAFSNLSILKAHLQIHTGEKLFSCPEYSKGFTFSSKLKRHLLVLMEEKLFTWPECSQEVRQVRRPADSHRPSLTYLDLQYTGRSTLGRGPSSAPRAANSADLQNHLLFHTREKSFTCHEFTRCNDLWIHQRIHTGERPFTCPKCGKNFTVSSIMLKMHPLVHTEEKPFTCPKCSKEFSRSNSLQIHQWIHTGERPYTCFKCGKMDILLKHQLVHT